MRWESANGYRPRETARSWTVKDSGSFGERPVLDRDYRGTEEPVENDILVHFGVPGMKWGVITKEYVKKGYNTAKRRLAIEKMKRQAANRASYEAMYRRGQNAAANTAFIHNRVRPILQKKKREEKANQPDAIDRMITRQADKYGLGMYGPMVSSFLKNAAKEKLIDALRGYANRNSGTSPRPVESKPDPKKQQQILSMGRSFISTVRNRKLMSDKMIDVLVNPRTYQVIRRGSKVLRFLMTLRG